MGISAGLDKVFNLKTDVDINYTEVNNNTVADFNFIGRGGNGSFQGNINSETGIMTNSFNDYVSSVNSTNSVAIDAADGSFIPIYEFISDPIKKEALRVEVDKYLASKSFTMEESGTILEQFYLNSTRDIILPIDYNGDGYDDLMIYRPGSCLVHLNESLGDGTFKATKTSSNGIAGYLFSSTLDRAVAFDYNGDGLQDLFCYHPGGEC